MSDVVAQAKRTLRSELRERRQLLSDQQRRAAASGLTEQLDILVGRHRAETISCFLSTEIEPDTRAFISAAVQRGIRVLLPISRRDGLLDWAVSGDTDDVSKGLFGLSEPNGELLGPAAIDDLDLMIVPAAAVDLHGTRLGWGRGYFDKAIAAMTNHPPIYAVTFDSEVLDSLPHEQHDQPVTGVVTPTRTIHLPHTRH